MKLQLHHIAILTHSLAAVEASLPPELEKLEVETFPGEGTKEQYIDLSPSGRPSLLLLEAIGDGPYREALQKRGAGLHHFGLITDRLHDAVDYFAGRRLLLHPITLKTVTQAVAWMCRPGIPFLVEIVAVDTLAEAEPPPVNVAMPGLPGKRLAWLPGVALSRAEDGLLRISTGPHAFTLAP